MYELEERFIIGVGRGGINVWAGSEVHVWCG